jgi:hypothetical protein
MEKKNQYAAEAMEHVTAIETAIGTYNTIKAGTDEHRRKLEAAQQNERGILAEIGSDREDAAERLIMASAIVRILSTRSDDGKIRRALEELANIVIRGESFAMGAALRIEHARLANEIERLCSSIEITVNRAPKPVTWLERGQEWSRPRSWLSSPNLLQVLNIPAASSMQNKSSSTPIGL